MLFISNRIKMNGTLNLRLVIFFIIIFASCNNPLHRTYSPATYEEDMQAIRKSDKVSDEDLEILAKYIILAKLSGNDVSGKSYDDILDIMKSFQQKNDELNNRDDIEKEAKRKRLSPFLEVKLQKKTFTKANNKNVLVYTVSVKNNGTLKIKTVTGNLTLNDFMGKPITNLNIFLDEDISHGQILTKIYNIDYNDDNENDRRIRSKDLFDIRAVWNPEKIIFENGKLSE